MISLRQSMKELDQAEVAHQTAARWFEEALRLSASNVVEINHDEAEAFRGQVLELAAQVNRSPGMEAIFSARNGFKEELQSYSERAAQHVSRMREELQAAAVAMQTFAAGVSSSTGEHETVLRREFGQLELAAESEDLRGVRAAIHETVHVVRQSYEEVKQAQILVIAQLRDEIRVLQSALERGQRRAERSGSQVAKRTLDGEFEELLRQDRGFAVVLAAVENLPELHGRYPRERLEAAVANMLESFTALARRHAPGAIVAAYGDNLFGVVLPSGTNVSDWARQLTVSHVFHLEGLPRTLRISPIVETVERHSGDSPAAFFEKLAHASKVLKNV